MKKNLPKTIDIKIKKLELIEVMRMKRFMPMWLTKNECKISSEILKKSEW